MNIGTCYKYFVFLNTECDRYLEDNQITDEEMHNLKIELDKFIERAKNSNLPVEIKDKIDSVKIDYEYKARREYGPLLARFNFGSRRRHYIQTKQVDELKYQIKGIPHFIKMNFDF